MEQSQLNLRMLLVEDNIAHQAATLEHLNQLKFEADIARDMRQAIAITAQQNYDVVLLGCEISIVDKYKTTQAIRCLDRDRFRRTVILAIIPDPMPDTCSDAIAIGIDDFLLSPVHADTLATTLQWWGRLVVPIQQLDQIDRSQAFNAPAPAIQPLPSNLPMNVHINWMYVRQLADGNAEFALELLQLFVKDSLRQIKTLEEAIVTGNLPQIEQVAHYLKGASANVGAIVVQRIAEQLEHQARYRQLQDPLPLLKELKQSLHSIHRCIKVQHP